MIRISEKNNSKKHEFSLEEIEILLSEIDLFLKNTPYLYF